MTQSLAMFFAATSLVRGKGVGEHRTISGQSMTESLLWSSYICSAQAQHGLFCVTASTDPSERRDWIHTDWIHTFYLFTAISYCIILQRY